MYVYKRPNQEPTKITRSLRHNWGISREIVSIQDSQDWQTLINSFLGHLQTMVNNGRMIPPQMKPGWWYTYPSEKYEFVSWDDEIPIWTNKIHVPNHQPDHYHIPINTINHS